MQAGAATCTAIEKQAGNGPVTLEIRGFNCTMQLHVSSDPVGAPIFYRDVPRMPSETQKGFIKPLAAEAVPLIEWRMRNVADSSSPVLMTGLHACANRHSFAGNGKTLGLAMDCPQSDKGLCAIVPVQRQMTTRTEDTIS